MADNVNIIVQDTINDIVVNAAVVVETIDINVQAAVDVVDIVANPNNYVVNINRIIGEQVQSDWDQTDNQAPDYIKNKPTIPTATSDLTNDGSDGINPFITAADIPPVTGFVPYTGATSNVDLGTHTLSAKDLVINHSSGSGVAIAFFCVVVILGGRNPFVVLAIVNCELAISVVVPIRVLPLVELNITSPTVF